MYIYIYILHGWLGRAITLISWYVLSIWRLSARRLPCPSLRAGRQACATNLVSVVRCWDLPDDTAGVSGTMKQIALHYVPCDINVQSQFVECMHALHQLRLDVWSNPCIHTAKQVGLHYGPCGLNVQSNQLVRTKMGMPHFIFGEKCCGVWCRRAFHNQGMPFVLFIQCERFPHAAFDLRRRMLCEVLPSSALQYRMVGQSISEGGMKA